MANDLEELKSGGNKLGLLVAGIIGTVLVGFSVNFMVRHPYDDTRHPVELVHKNTEAIEQLKEQLAKHLASENEKDRRIRRSEIDNLQREQLRVLKALLNHFEPQK